MIVYVTGGAGFLGSHLCDKLIEQSHQVVCIDNLLTGTRKNIEHLLDNPNFEFLEHDVTKPLPDNIHADQVYHLASPASPNFKSPKSYHALAFETMQVNTTGTWNLAQWCVKNGAKFLFASTSEIYGDPLQHPQKEEYRGNVSTTGPRSVYDEAKRFGETITAAFIRSKGLDGKIIRIFNTYGPRMAIDDGRVVTEFIKASLEHRFFPVFGDGTQTRSFCYVSDLIDGIVLTMKKGAIGEIYNLGNPNEYTVLELGKKIIKLTNSESELVTKEPLPEDDPLQRCPDITKAKDQLGWVPKIGLEEGLKKTIEYYNGKLNH
ncbi:GDP-mannose 4,6-dehydratase [Candidatus Daviesbacteria bacterium]|nr:GDP-mannose 4,6-dehydratase [Candidatus Daviesbacteria bacterium]